MDKDMDSGVVRYMSEVGVVAIVGVEVNVQALLEGEQVCKLLTLAPLGKNCGGS